MKKIFFPLFAAALVLAACNGNDPTDTTDSGTTITQTNTGDDDTDFVENQTWSRTVNIVWNGSSAGGTCLWNGVANNGKRVASGVYHVVANTPEGGKAIVTRIVVVR